MDGVELEIAPDAMTAVAEKAIERNTGARGLRSILEEIMTDIMFEIPSRDDVAKVVITADCILNHAAPELVLK
jgi:ATP-dependent Clp protease ATP-binding subunit ClpX